MRPSLVLACSLSLSLCSLSGSFFFLRGQEREKKRERALVLEEARAGKRKKGRVETLPALVCEWRFGREERKKNLRKKQLSFSYTFFSLLAIFLAIFFLHLPSLKAKKQQGKKKTSARAQLVVSLFIYLSVYLSLFPRNGAQSLCVFMVKNSKKTKKNLIFCLSPFSSFLKIPPMAASPPRPRGRLRRTSRHRH